MAGKCERKAIKCWENCSVVQGGNKYFLPQLLGFPLRFIALLVNGLSCPTKHAAKKSAKKKGLPKLAWTFCAPGLPRVTFSVSTPRPAWCSHNTMDAPQDVPTRHAPFDKRSPGNSDSDSAAVASAAAGRGGLRCLVGSHVCWLGHLPWSKQA